ncbi:MAG: class I SAM-dependent methyltransferase [Promicromonosporaceae bacterium]|nr:class I SAM-dependent methyltransferase [Promicromonosporaceae bacterium]
MLKTEGSDAAETLNKDPAEIAARFTRIARRYDLVNDVVSMGRSRTWRRVAVAALAPVDGELILDLAGGTGTSAVPIAELGARVTVCDISEGMLEVGRQRHPHLVFVAGNALALPFETASFDAATISFGLRNMPDTAAVLRELARVVRPGGRLVIAEFSHPTNVALRVAYAPYLRFILPTVAGLITGDRDSYTYFAESIKQWPAQHTLAELLSGAGWQEVSFQNLHGGIVALHLAKRS